MNDGLNIFEYLIPGYATLSLFKWLAARIGCHEAALRLIFSLLLSYPVCLFYNIALAKQSSTLKHLYLFISGISIGFFNYGFNILHTFTATCVTFSMLKYVGATKQTVLFNFIFCMTYLLWGYYKTQRDEYAFEWTIPQCVLTLRLISLTFDCYDGRMEIIKSKKNDNDEPTSTVDKDKNGADRAVIDERSSSSDHRNGQNTRNVDSDHQSATENTATTGDKREPAGDVPVKRVSDSKNPDALYLPLQLLNVLGYAYFPASFLVGPQFAYKRYLTFTANTDNHLPVSFNPGFKKLVFGLTYLAIFQTGSLYWPLKYLLTPEFEALNHFLLKFTVVAITMKIQLCKYISIWLISEGCCIISGINYDKESDQFVGCSNVNIWEFETTPTFSGLIRSFNITTNMFASKYIFKRLKFLGNKAISQSCTLFFLAAWHGWKSGYYVTFSLEFIIMKLESEMSAKIGRLRKKHKKLDDFLNLVYVRYLIHALMRVYLMYMFAYCLVSFTLLTSYKWYPVLSQLYFSGHLIYLSWFFIGFLF